MQTSNTPKTFSVHVYFAATQPQSEAEAAKAAAAAAGQASSNDWMFLNYTYKRFDGLTQRGRIPASSSYAHS